MSATLIDKLRAMAQADESPHEAAIAQAKLATMGAGGRVPPQRPPAAPAPDPEPLDVSWSFSSSTNTNTSNGAWTVSW